MEKGDDFRKGVGAKLETWVWIQPPHIGLSGCRNGKGCFSSLDERVGVNVANIIIGRKGIFGRSSWVRKGVKLFLLPKKTFIFAWTSTSGGLEQNDEFRGDYKRAPKKLIKFKFIFLKFIKKKRPERISGLFFSSHLGSCLAFFSVP